jgi:hypothetical protein
MSKNFGCALSIEKYGNYFRIRKTCRCSNLLPTMADVPGSVHVSIIHTEIANKMKLYIKIYYSMFIWSSACFRRHTAYHQELKTALAASGHGRVEYELVQCTAPVSTLCDNVHQTQRPLSYMQIPEAASAVFSSWSWAVCRPKHVELHINIE